MLVSRVKLFEVVGSAHAFSNRSVWVLDGRLEILQGRRLFQYHDAKSQEVSQSDEVAVAMMILASSLGLDLVAKFLVGGRSRR